MNEALIDNIVQTVLYEGYTLYPYRRSIKNQQRWTFGCLFPRAYAESAGGEPYRMQSQCLLRGGTESKIAVKVRFLQLVDRAVGRCDEDGSCFEPVDQIEIAGTRYQKWQEAIERSVTVEADLSGDPSRHAFKFPADRTVEIIRDGEGKSAAALVRTSELIDGVVEVEVAHERDDVYRLTVQISNLATLQRENSSRDDAQIQSMASTHAIMHLTGGGFISAIDPPADLADATRQLTQVGGWPVLVGEGGATDAMLASPIILYDYPQLAPESPGDLFDGTEIDEILSLRVMTLTDDEKKSAVDLDPKLANLIGRTDQLARDQLARLHGSMRPPKKVLAVHVGDAELRAGDKVKLVPRGRADAFDIILRGKIATIVAIEQDFESRIHLGVTVDDDPGADIGAAGKIGHRFFFRLDEVEPYRDAPMEASAL